MDEGTGSPSRSLRIVVLESPIHTWASEQTRVLWGKLVELKLQGYHAEYPPNVVPFEKDDFFGTHLLICEEKGRALDPVVAYKSVTLERCDYHRYVFPALTILRTSRADDSALIQILDRCRQERIPLSYDSSWTMRPDIRKDRAYARYLRDVATLIGVSHHRDYGIPEWVTMGIKRFKTDDYFRWMGHQPITVEYRAFGSSDEPAMMLHLQSFSEEAVQVAETLRHLWDRRIEISGRSSGTGSKAA